MFRDAAAEAERLWEPLTPEEEEAHQRALMERVQAMHPGAAGRMMLTAVQPDPPDREA